LESDLAPADFIIVGVFFPQSRRAKPEQSVPNAHGLLTRSEKNQKWYPSADHVEPNRAGSNCNVVGKSNRLPTFDLFAVPKNPNKHSIVFRGRKTSVSLEAPFWAALQKIASERRQTISDTVASISAERKTRNLSSAVRVFVLDYFFNAMNVSNNNQNTATQAVESREAP
jgi:predicted DNA-binding ribbon-helix-helix protein